MEVWTLMQFSRALPLFCFAATAWGAEAPVEFNRDIRPIFSDKCFTCHGPDAANRKTKLRFDVESDAKMNLGKGRVSIIPGDPENSEVFKRITSSSQALRMPPQYAGHAKLTGAEIGLVRRWIAEGAKWAAHWSFVAPVRPDLPAVIKADWPRNPIDRFVLARLEREGMQPSPEADRRTLIRRVTLDLTGIPPTPAEVEEFLSDKAANAYEKAVDRLLASTRYAERMAFRWMEAARYADTNGYQTDGVRDMWRWRDWVIDAFHRNIPFDRFTIEQLAGDLLPSPTLDQRIATGFHRNHRTSAEGGIVPEEFRVEYVADRAETTSTVWLGLTTGCARCHDHKYDPIPQKDFYKLFAFFNSVPEKGLVYNFGNEEPYIKAPTPEQQAKLSTLDSAVERLKQEANRQERQIRRAQAKWERGFEGPDWTETQGLVYRQENAGPELPEVGSPGGAGRSFDGEAFIETDGGVANFNYLDPFTFTAWIRPEKETGAILSHAEDFFEGQGHGLYLIDGKVRLHIVFRWTDIGLRLETEKAVELNEWQHVAVSYDGKRKSSGVQILVNGAPQQLNVLFEDLNWPMDFKLPLRVGAGGGLRWKGAIADARVYKRALTGDEALAVFASQSIAEIAAIRADERTPAQSAKLRLAFLDTAAPDAIRGTRAQLAQAVRERDRYHDSLPTVMVMQESPDLRESFVLNRGAYDAPGEKVSPGVPSMLPPMKPEWPANRLGLARWLVDRSNPLTARVAVNRFWQMYFGTGLVKTVDDFGSQGEWPLYSELLDWLAVEFMDSGWDVKAFQKTVVTSAVYRQSSRLNPDLLARDPENRLLARGPRLRLGPEVLRDQALAASGLLVEKTGGPSVKPYQPPGLWQELAGGKGYVIDKGEGLYRRSLYTYWKRTVAPPFMVNFDSPNRETCTVRETRTNTPLQALNLMNDVTFLEAARKLAERVLQEGGATAEERVDFAYRLVLGRNARDREIPVLLSALRDFEARYRSDLRAADAFLRIGDSPVMDSANRAELAAWTAIASLVLNLDEAVTKE